MSLLVHCLVVLFGSSSWLSVNGVLMELPIMVNELPEGWSLPSYLIALVQLSSIGPLIYSILHKCTNVTLHPAPLITALLALDCLATLFLVFFWNNTYELAGDTRSLGLFVIFFVLSFVNCTSNVLFLPYMAIFKHSYMTAYFVGMGLSALFPSVIALIQGSGHTVCQLNNVTNQSFATQIPARFSVEVFNGLMLAWMCMCMIAFLLLNWAPFAKRERLYPPEKSLVAKPELDVDQRLTDEETNAPTVAVLLSEVTPLHHRVSLYIYILLLVALVCALQNGVIPSIQSYSTLPYGQLTYHLSVALSNIANPVACFIPFFLVVRSPFIISILSFVATLLTAYIVALAVMSPEPIFMESHAGSILCVLACILAVGLIAYLRTVMAGVLREGDGDSESRLFWCGVFTQIGSVIGAVIMFPLVNVYALFTSANYC